MRRIQWLLTISWSVLGILILPNVSFGQTDRVIDKVMLNNGSVIWGITELDKETVKIFLSQDDSVLIPLSMIRSLKTQKFNPEIYLERSQGNYYQFSSGVLLGKSHQSSVNTGSFAISFTSGYRFKYNLAAGLGAGLNYYPEQRHVPVYLDVQGDLLKTRFTPFYQLSTGWSWADERESISAIAKVEGGFYIRPAFGIRWHFAKYSWHLQFSYVRQNSTTHFEPLDLGNGNVITNVEDRTFQRFGISAGISF